jgi:acetylglutamate kinase
MIKESKSKPVAELLIKLGGEAASLSSLPQIAGAVSRLCQEGRWPVILHDADQQVAALEVKARARRRQSGGRRVMDAEAISNLSMALGGVNMALCAALRGAGVEAVGLSMALYAERRGRERYGGSVPLDLGAVGDPIGVDEALLKGLLRGGRVPVLACIGVTQHGELLSVPFDAAAHVVMRGLCAAQLVLLAGAVDEGKAPRSLSLRQARDRLAGVGPLEESVYNLRLSEACRALELGVATECVIASFTGKGLGGGKGATVLRA